MHQLEPKLIQYLLAFDLTCRHKNRLKVKRKRKIGGGKEARFRLCDMSCFCQCQDYRHPQGFGDGSIHCQRWIIGYFE